MLIYNIFMTTHKTKTANKKSTSSSKSKPTKKITFKVAFRQYLSKGFHLAKYQKIGIFLLIIVFSGFAGWLWEFSLDEISGGFKHIYIKGGNFLPWINLYAYGAILIIPMTYKLRRYPWAVFVIASIGTGLLELLAGWLVYTLGNGTRYWDYTERWWGFGNINGFVCPVSAITFGIGALLLMYLLVPFCIKLALNMKKRAFLTFTITIFALVMVDDITNLTLKNLGLPTAMDFYHSLGFKYK